MDFREVGDGFVGLNGDTAYALEGDAAAEYRAGGLSRRRLLAAIGAGAAVAGVSAVVGPAAAAHASLITGNLVVTLNPTSGPSGQVVQVTVTNLPTVAGTAITTVTVAGTPVTPSNTTVTSGTANFTITIPNNEPLTGLGVVVHDNHNNQGTATYTVVAPTVTITPTSQAKHTGPGSGSGTFHVATSSGFAPNSALTVTFTPNTPASGAILTLTGGPSSTDSSGQIPTSPNYSFTNNNGTGSNTITFKDASGNTATATFSFT